MMQLYVLSLLYLILGAGMLLADTYGLNFALLLSLRYAFRTRRWLRRLLIISGLFLTLGLGFFPMDPGPILLGDAVPMFNIFSLTLYYLFQAMKNSDESKGDEASVLDATGRYMEQNKRNVGILTLVIALLHFLAPQLVLM